MIFGHQFKTFVAHTADLEVLRVCSVLVIIPYVLI